MQNEIAHICQISQYADESTHCCHFDSNELAHRRTVKSNNHCRMWAACSWEVLYLLQYFSAIMEQISLQFYIAFFASCSFSNNSCINGHGSYWSILSPILKSELLTKMVCLIYILFSSCFWLLHFLDPEFCTAYQFILTFLFTIDILVN